MNKIYPSTGANDTSASSNSASFTKCANSAGARRQQCWHWCLPAPVFLALVGASSTGPISNVLQAQVLKIYCKW